ncbi:MAG TPA: WXG100 family type VII secretion target [Streptosporangiaceae bacterium]|nr:WXG100 family type VII secretion target [Streptosporangiaceae bacterium]
MNSEYTRVVFGQMEQGQADFARTYSQLQSTISTMDAQLRSSLSQWDGAAQQAYYHAKAVWDAAMADMANVLNQLGAVIGVANDNYMSAESANTALWGG